MSQNRLGRGLSTLIPQKTTRLTGIDEPKPSVDAGIATISVENIHPCQKIQPRYNFDDESINELAASIKSSGLIQPILVRPKPDQPDQYEVIAGERRLRAAKVAGLAQIPALVRRLQDREAAELALIENIQRVDLYPVERALAYHNYISNFNIGADELALRLGESRASVTNYLRLLRLNDEILKMINQGQLGMGQARAIVGIDDPKRQLAVARLAVRRNLSVRQVEELAARTTAAVRSADLRTADEESARRHIDDVERSLATALGLRVTLQTAKRKNAGRVVIHYNSLEEFDLISQRLGAPATMA